MKYEHARVLHGAACNVPPNLHIWINASTLHLLLVQPTEFEQQPDMPW